MRRRDRKFRKIDCEETGHLIGGGCWNRSEVTCPLGHGRRGGLGVLEVSAYAKHAHTQKLVIRHAYTRANTHTRTHTQNMGAVGVKSVVRGHRGGRNHKVPPHTHIIRQAVN